jgi:hypothetical protein
MVNFKSRSHATSRWTYRVLLGVLFKSRLNGWDYTASIVDEIHVSTGRWWNDTVMGKQKVLGHTLSQYDFVEHKYQRNAFGLNSDLRGKMSGINRPVHGTACELQNTECWRVTC